ncbi:MAG TPA: hypothetical protein DET40_23290 [Lentisphaeria bacterium]|nr:hypothetical protein [Lentisphaeria bacterium]
MGKFSMNSLRKKTCLWIFLIALATVCTAQDKADKTDLRRGIFQTPLKVGDLDPAAYAEWSDGREAPIPDAQKKNIDRMPVGMVWVQDSRTRRPYGYEFGKSKALGVRHIRIGFTKPVPIGAILAGGNIRVSVLKAEAAYPGNMADESQWIPAQRIKDGKVTGDELKGREDSALWTLPPATQSRAIRFSHTTSDVADVVGDGLYAGTLGGAYVLPERFANIAPIAAAVTRNSNEKASRLNNGNRDGYWNGWENINGGNKESFAAAKLVAEDPEWIMLVWPRPVSLRGLAFLVPFFYSADIQIYKGAETTHPRDAVDADWETVTNVSGLRTLYPLGLPVSWLDFEKDVTTRAVRLRITAPFVEDADVQNREHGHTKGHSMGGKRVELCELMALHALGKEKLETALPVVDAKDDETKNLIPVKFTLPEDGFVTLVIEDKDGKRIRNLVSETPFKKGGNIAWWDGTDDLGRDFDAASHGLYHIPEQLVGPGEYRVRGLWRKDIDYRYEFSVYSNGNPPWSTRDNTGAWLANHTPPQSALFIPAAKSPTKEPVVYLGAYITEGPDGLIWVDLDGKKRGGKKWVGGTWTAAPYLARDDGPDADPKARLYVASVGTVDYTDKKTPTAELRVTALTDGQDKPVLVQALEKISTPETTSQGTGLVNYEEEICGLAAYNGIVACSMNQRNQLYFINAKDGGDRKMGEILAKIAVDSPRGIAYDGKGRLLVISGKQVLFMEQPMSQQKPKVIVSSGLEDPFGITLDHEANIYVSDRGSSHQVKVFNPQGKLVRAIGNPGAPKAGPYDQRHMNNPRGIAVDSKKQLWVTEQDFLPKRVSVWTTDGKFVNAFYGPPKYGGGGALDSADKNIFYHADDANGLMEFKLDWEKGTSQLTSVPYRPSAADLKLPDGWAGGAAPERSLYREVPKYYFFKEKQRYFTNCYNSNPTNGSSPTFIFEDFDGIIRPVAAAGVANYWNILKDEKFKPFWPKDVDVGAKDPGRDNGKNLAFFIWSDLNCDSKVQPDEVVFQKGRSGGVTVMPDFSLCVAHVGDKAMKFSPTNFTEQGVPTYDFSKGQVLAEGVTPSNTSGGSQALVDSDGNTVITLGVKPFLTSSLCGGRDGGMTWSYPSLWPGLHPSHEAPKPDRLGELIGTTRLLGGFVNPKGSEAGPLWCINGNMGNVYLFTSDGLFVASLFEDIRIGRAWQIPIAQRGMSLKGISPYDEHFWPTINQASDGQVYLVYNKEACALIKIEGLETLRRLPAGSLSVTADDLKKVQAYQVALEEKRKLEQGGGVMHVSVQTTVPTVDGKLDDWTGASWVEIEKRGVGAYFDSKSKPYDIRGAVVVADGKLFAAWRTGNKDLLRNSGEMPLAPFKTGGTLELMIGSNSNASPKRRSPVEGDMRLLVTQVKGKTKALIYRPVVPGTPDDRKVPFSSPWRTIKFDQVEDVSDKVQLTADGKGAYEISIPLKILGLNPAAGKRIKGDIGILRGDGAQTMTRIYWSNKATGIVSDVPSEAELVPALWGDWEFR